MSITMLLEMAAAAYDGRTALGNRIDGISYERLSRTVAGGAGVIGASGAGSVAFVGLNGPALPALLLASAAAGVPFSPLNYRLSAGGLDQLLAELDSPLIVVDDAFERVLRHHDRIMTAGAWLDGAHAAHATAPVAEAAGDACAVLLFTSGTTGRPKGVVLHHENLVSYVVGTVEFGSADPGDAVLISVPPYHVAAIGSALTNLYAGRRMVYLPNFDPAAWLALVADEGVTSAMVVPTMLARIVEHLGDATAEVPTLRTLAYGGARMPATVLERALELFPQVGFVNAYGLTETSSTIAVLTPEDHRQALASDDPRLRARLISAGRPVPGVEVEVRGPDGRTKKSGEAGELWVRGPQVSGVYQGIGSVLDDDGWFPTRDRARIDADGYLFIEGRADDTIIRGGENIAPAEIEDVLVRHEAVREVAVVGVPDDEWGERIVAAIVPHEGAVVDTGEIRSFVRARLRGSRTPDEVVVRRELPYTPTGKLLRREIVAGLTSPAPHGRT